MRKALFYALIVALYLLIPVSISGILGTMVSQKYEVDHGRTFIDINDDLTESEKALKHQEVDELEKELYVYQALWTVLLLIGVLVPTGTLVMKAKRRKNISA